MEINGNYPDTSRQSARHRFHEVLHISKRLIEVNILHSALHKLHNLQN